MSVTFTEWSLILLCFSMAGAIGGGLYEHVVLTPMWSASPPASFAIIQPGTGVPLQRFWMPVHAAITLFVMLSLALTWRDHDIRRLLLIGLSSYVVMRIWSFFFFIREMLAFQKVPTASPPSPELSARVARWTFWSWFREPLDVISFLCFLLALSLMNRPASFVAMQARGRTVMGVDQYASAHAFEDLEDGGRIVLEADNLSDTAGIVAIRQHMRDIAAAFRAGDFAKPFQVHAQAVPGTSVMAARRAKIAYEAADRPRGGEVRIRTTDRGAVAAVHEFLAFQRTAHHASAHEAMRQ